MRYVTGERPAAFGNSVIIIGFVPFAGVGTDTFGAVWRGVDYSNLE